MSDPFVRQESGDGDRPGSAASDLTREAEWLREESLGGEGERRQAEQKHETRNTK
ncbi:MAG TPA: hypothetical protein VF701_21125 [Thermoanaerobaculia bacterium]